MPTNLELFNQPTRFVGRETELLELNSLLENADCHLLTLVGVGGIGKTRLAIQLARALQPAFGDGTWFVNLQALQSGAQIVPAVMDALEIVPSAHGSLEDQLLQYLQSKKILLLFDNFEHLLDGAGLLTRIIQLAPQIKLLATSREALGLPEEWLYPLEGLPTPQSHQVERVELNAAVALFVERARQVSRNFSLDDNRAGVVRICQLVDGNPLALEMASSWTKSLRCSEIAAEIQQNINFLSSNLRHIPERHRSMQAVFAQTWTRLPPDEQTLFKRLAIFRSGFQRPAAESIAGASLPLLSSLMDKCLLRREAGNRYQIHELLRQFAYSRLEPDESQALAEAHCHYYTDFLARRTLGLVERSQVEACAEIEPELENIHMAWTYALEHNQLQALKGAVGPYFYFCQIESRYLESAQASGLAAQVFEQAGDLPSLAQALVHQAWMLIRIGRFDQATRGLERSRILFEELLLRPAYGMGTHPLAPLIILKVVQGDYARAVVLGEELKELSTLGMDQHNLSFACYGLTSAYLNQGEYEAALENAQQAVQVADQIGNHWFSAYCLIELGNVHLALGHYAEAERCYRSSLQIKQAFRDPEGIAVNAKHLGEIALLQHDYPAAQALFEQSLAVYQELNDQGGLAAAYQGLGQVAVQAGDGALAARHFRTALEIAMRISFVPLLLSLLIDIGSLMLENDRTSRGLELLRQARDHPASSRQQREKASTLLENRLNGAETPLPDLNATLITLQSELLDFTPPAPAARESPLIEPLTERELDVLQLLRQGLSNPEIAESLVISVGTVKAHTNRIYSKLGVTNRVEAVLKAQGIALLKDKSA